MDVAKSPEQAQKLTKWNKEPTVLDLKGDLEASRPMHNAHIARIQYWNHLRNVTGPAAPKKRVGRSSVQPKVIRRQAEWRYPALSEPFLSDAKVFQVQPATFEDGPAATQNELLLNWQFRTKINRVNFIDEYIRTLVDEGTVIVRLGWHRVVEQRPVKLPIWQYMRARPEDAPMLEQALALKETNPRGFADLPEEVKAAIDYTIETGVLAVALKVGEQDSTEDVVVENRPTLEIMDSENVFIDPSCQGDIDKATFVVVSFESSKAELLRDGRYKNLNAVNWSGNTVLSQPDHATKTPNDFQFKDDLRKRIIVYEYWGLWDIDGNETLKPIVASWVGDTLIRCEENPFPDQKPPFVVATYLPIRKSVMGEPDAEVLEDNQKVIGAITRGAIDLLGRSANGQIGHAKGWLDATNKRRYERGDDYEFNPNLGPDVAVKEHTYPEIPVSALNMLNLQNFEAESMSGVKAFATGLSGEAYGDVAAAVKGMLDAAGKREMSILRRPAMGMQQIGTKIIAMNAVFLSEEEVVRVTNKKFVSIKREDLKGNFDCIVDISTPEVDMARAQDLGFMLQTMGPEMDPGMQRLVLSEIAELKRMPDLAERIRTYEPKPDPLVEELKRLEVEEKRWTVEKLKTEAEKNKALAAKAVADAGKAESEADLNNLEFVEEETGTKHARDLEKQKEQAQGNQSLEVTKALLKALKEGERQPDVEAAVGFNAITDLQSRARL